MSYYLSRKKAFLENPKECFILLDFCHFRTQFSLVLALLKLKTNKIAYRRGF